MEATFVIVQSTNVESIPVTIEEYVLIDLMGTSVVAYLEHGARIANTTIMIVLTILALMVSAWMISMVIG